MVWKLSLKEDRGREEMMTTIITSIFVLDSCLKEGVHPTIKVVLKYSNYFPVIHKVVHFCILNSNLRIWLS